ncbi:MAG: cobalamin-dependent protein [Spirochaetes bacterium]|nr:cobalamin-dependent protein [Spirochaetota bacterium]
MKNTLFSAVVNLDERNVIRLTKDKLKYGQDPISLLDEICLGVEEIGKRYAKGKYFIADLIMSGLIFKEVTKYICFPKENIPALNKIKVLFATVEADIHDVGKNVTIDLFKAKGINVTDLGVDVSPCNIAEEVEKQNIEVLCLSGLISSSYNSMRKTIKLLEEKQLRDKVKVIIGGNVDENVKIFTGADYWVKECTHGLKICIELAQKKSLVKCI